MSEIYEVLAVKYAERQNRIRAENFIMADDHNAPHPMDYFVWVVRNANRTIVVDTGFDDFARRMPRELPLGLTEIRPEPRRGKPVDALLAAEESRIRAALPQRSRIVALDERGTDSDTRESARRPTRWLSMVGADIGW